MGQWNYRLFNLTKTIFPSKRVEVISVCHFTFTIISALFIALQGGAVAFQRSEAVPGTWCATANRVNNLSRSKYIGRIETVQLNVTFPLARSRYRMLVLRVG